MGKSTTHSGFQPSVVELLVHAHLQAQRADGVADYLGAVGAEEDEVAVLRSGALENPLHRIVGQEFHDRRLQAFLALGRLVDLDVRETLGAVTRHERGVIVDLRTRHRAAARHAQRRHAALRILRGPREHLEVAARDEIGDVHEFERVAQVRLVGAETAHGFCVTHARERIGQIDPDAVLEEVTRERLHRLHDLVLRQERRLDVELREFRLAIGAQVLVAETLHDLVVAVEPRDHQQLLEDLRRLRQREELAGVRARGHEVVARAFGRGFGQYRRFDIHEAGVIEISAHRASYLVAQTQALRHVLATQVDVAVLEAHLFTHVFVELERQRLGAVQRHELARQQLHLARGEVRVRGACGALAHQSPDLDHELVAQLFGLAELGLVVGIEDHLQQAFAVAQVDEDHATVIAAAVNPSGNRNLLTDQLFIDLAAIVRTHGNPGDWRVKGRRCYRVAGRVGKAKLRGRLPRRRRTGIVSRRSLALRALAVLTLLGGCSPEQALEKFTNDEEQARAIELIEMMRDGKVEELAPEMRGWRQSRSSRCAENLACTTQRWRPRCWPSSSRWQRSSPAYGIATSS